MPEVYKPSSDLIQALDKYMKAKECLAKHTGFFKTSFDESTMLLSCPDCGAEFWRGTHGQYPLFDFPIICCGKIRLM